MQALRLNAAAGQRGLSALQRGQCRIDIGTERCRVDLEQGLAGTDFRALFEQAPLHDAAHLGSDLCGAHRRHAAGQFVIALHHLRTHAHHADTRRRFRGGFGEEQAVMAKARAAINATGVLKVLIAVHNAAQAADRF